MNEFLTFRRFLTPLIIQALFWIGSGICVIMGLITIVGGAAGFGGGASVLFGLLTIVLGPVVVRIECELLILLFRMYESLESIERSLTRSGSGV